MLPGLELLNPSGMRLFSFKAGDSIRERVGGTITSLIVVGVSWMAAFVILEDLESDSLLVSELQDKLEKTIKLIKIMKLFFMKVNA